MEWTPWRGLQSSGQIDDDQLPATLFQLRRFLLLRADLTSHPGPIGYLNWDGEMTWDIRDDASNKVFEQTTWFSLTLVYQKTGDVLAFFAWWWEYPAHRIQTTIPQPCYMATGFQAGLPQVLMARIGIGANGLASFQREASSPFPTACGLLPVGTIGGAAINATATMSMARGQEPASGSLPAGATTLENIDGASNAYLGCLGASVAGGTPGDAFHVASRGWVYSPSEQGLADPSSYPPGHTQFEDLPGQSGYTDHEVIVGLYYYAPGYAVDLTPGSKVSITKNEISGDAFWPLDLASVSIRTAGESGFGSMIDTPGFHRLAIGSATTAEQLVSADGGLSYYGRRIGDGMRRLQIAKTPQNHLVVGGYAGQHYRLLLSKNDGRTWGTLQSLGEAPVPDDIWPAATYADPDFAITRQGRVVSIARAGAALSCKTSADGFSRSHRIGQVARNTWRIAYDDERDRLLVTDGKTGVYLSKNAGMTWEQVPAEGLSP